MRKHTPPMTAREALIERLKTYREEVRSGRHVPPPLSTASPLQTEAVVDSALHL